MKQKKRNKKPYEISVYDIPEGGLEIAYGERDRWLIDLLSEKGLEKSSPFEAALSLERIDRIICVKGTVRGRLHLFCSRCGEDFNLTLDHRFSAGFSFGSTDLRQKDEVELAAGEMGLSHLESIFLNPVDILGEQLILETPMKPLCQESCKGRCLQCGTKLNEGECHCEVEEKRNPFHVLKKLNPKSKR